MCTDFLFIASGKHFPRGSQVLNIVGMPLSYSIWNAWQSVHMRNIDIVESRTHAYKPQKIRVAVHVQKRP